MRIGIDGRGYLGSLDGIGRYTRTLISNLLELDNENEYVIFVLPNTDWSFVEKYSNARLFVYPHRHLSLATVHKLGPIVDNEGVDVFHSLFFVAPMNLRAGLLITVHDLMALTYPGFFGERFIIGQILATLYHRVYVPGSIRRADALVAVSDFTRQQLREYLQIPVERISVIYNMVDVNFKPEADSETDTAILRKYGLERGYLLYVGNTKPYKNIEGLLRGYARYQIKANEENDTHVPLVLAGKPDRFRKRVERGAEVLKIQERIRFLDEIPDADLPALMRGALALVQPSHVEGFGLPALEAMACGTPVIGSTASALSEVLGRSALLFPSDDSTKLGECILQLARSPELREKLSREGAERATNFRKESIVRQMLQLYRKVAAAKNQSIKD